MNRIWDFGINNSDLKKKDMTECSFIKSQFKLVCDIQRKKNFQ